MGLCHGMDAACPDDDVIARVVIVSCPGAGLLLAAGGAECGCRGASSPIASLPSREFQSATRTSSSSSSCATGRSTGVMLVRGPGRWPSAPRPCPAQEGRVAPAALASRYQGRKIAAGSNSVPAATRPPARPSPTDRADLAESQPACRRRPLLVVAAHARRAAPDPIAGLRAWSLNLSACFLMLATVRPALWETLAIWRVFSWCQVAQHQRSANRAPTCHAETLQRWVESGSHWPVGRQHRTRRGHGPQHEKGATHDA